MPRYRNFLSVVFLSLMVAMVYFVSAKLFVRDVNIFDKLSAESLSEIENTRRFDIMSEAAGYFQSSSTRRNRRVTPSLAELGERGYLPNTNENVLMVTRIPHAGAELMVLLLQRLEGPNNFKHIRLPQGDSETLTSLQQELLVEEITSIIKEEAVPLTFDGDTRFLNFSTFGRQAPTFISIVRDPLDPRMLHRFQTGESSVIYSGSIAHFCGQDIRCTKRNNKWALREAKTNVMKWYPVVGILSHIEDTLLVLQREFPRFFRGASDVYKKIRIKEYRPSKVEIPPNSFKHLKHMLTDEVEFYNWLKWRLLNQTNYIRSSQYLLTP